MVRCDEAPNSRPEGSSTRTVLVRVEPTSTQSTDETLAGIAAKAVKEVDYHRDHSAQWVLRLAQGTDESREKMIHGFKVIWPYVDELFRDDELTATFESSENSRDAVPEEAAEPRSTPVEQAAHRARAALENPLLVPPVLTGTGSTTPCTPC